MFQQIENNSERNSVFLDVIVKSSDDTVYSHLIECLQKFGQGKLAYKLVDISEELAILSGSKLTFFRRSTLHMHPSAIRLTVGNGSLMTDGCIGLSVKTKVSCQMDSFGYKGPPCRLSKAGKL